MSHIDAARAHLGKAQEFLEAAHVNQELGLLNAATSDAVISGINAKDAICLTLTRKTGKADNHQEAVGELRRAGPAGADVASTLNRLLGLKTKSQYQSASIAATDAGKAIQWAARLLESATQVVTSR